MIFLQVLMGFLFSCNTDFSCQEDCKCWINVKCPNNDKQQKPSVNDYLIKEKDLELVNVKDSIPEETTAAYEAEEGAKQSTSNHFEKILFYLTT